jgi:hypothetical protein
MLPTIAGLSPPSMWVSEHDGWQVGSASNGRITCQTASIGPMMTALRNAFHDPSLATAALGIFGSTNGPALSLIHAPDFKNGGTS